MDASISQLDTAEGKLLTVILRDVTERVRAQEDLAAFATEANAIREQEKSRVARELHDELAQSLTALKMDTIWVRENLGGDPQAVERKLADMLAMLDASVAATRRIAADLRPLLLDDLGLVPAIEWLVQNFEQRTGMPVRAGCGRGVGAARALCDGRVSHRAGVAGERGQAFEGHAGHASPSRAAESSCCSACGTTASGSRPARQRKPHSLGLAGLRERAQLLKGTISVRQPARRRHYASKPAFRSANQESWIDPHRDCRRPCDRARRASSASSAKPRTWRWWTKRPTATEVMRAGARARLRRAGAGPVHARAQRHGADQAGQGRKTQAAHPGAEHAPGAAVRGARHQVGRQRLPHQGKRAGAAGAGHPQDRRAAAPSSAPRWRSSWRWARCPARKQRRLTSRCPTASSRCSACWSAGVSVTDIAARLNLSVKTVSTHKANLMQKMGLAKPDRAGALCHQARPGRQQDP